MNIVPSSPIPSVYILIAKVVAVALLIIAAIAVWNNHLATQQKIGYDRAMAEVSAKQSELREEKRNGEISDQRNSDKDAKDAQIKINKLQADVASAQSVADGLRKQLSEIGRAGKACNSGTANPGESDSSESTVGVLSNLFISADRATEAVSVYADELWIAAETCERRYDALISR